MGEDIVSITIAVVTSSAFTALIQYCINRRKNNIEIKILEQKVISDKLDQANIIVSGAIRLLDEVQTERDRLIKDKADLEQINNDLSQQVELLKNNINNIIDPNITET